MYIFFSSEDCGACQAMRQLKVALPVDTTYNNVHQDDWFVADIYGVVGIPCLVHVPSGQMLSGVKTQKQINNWIKQHG